MDRLHTLPFFCNIYSSIYTVLLWLWAATKWRWQQSTRLHAISNSDSSVMTFLCSTVTMWRWYERTLESTSGTFVLCEGCSHRCLFIVTECASRPGLLFIISLLNLSARGWTHTVRTHTSEADARENVTFSPSILHTIIWELSCMLCELTLTCQLYISCLNTPFHDQPLKTHSTPTDVFFHTSWSYCWCYCHAWNNNSWASQPTDTHRKSTCMHAMCRITMPTGFALQLKICFHRLRVMEDNHHG